MTLAAFAGTFTLIGIIVIVLLAYFMTGSEDWDEYP